MNSSGRLTFSAAAAGLLLLSAAGGARADGPAMPLGDSAAIPPGFLALCETQPEECAGPGASPRSLAEVRAWAGRMRWSQIFAASGLSTPVTASRALAVPGADLPSPYPASIKVDRTRDSLRAEKDASRKAVTRKRTPGTKAVPALPAPRAPVAPPVAVAPAPPVVAAIPPRASNPTLETLEAVNRRINRTIRRSSDQETFGQPDVWVAPVGARPRGDCEDYVLAKRRALIEAGTRPEALSIALVTTRRGEAHAVLLVATADGEYVLDNLSPWVVRWDQAPYEWQERQLPGSALTWVRADVRSRG